MNLLLQLADSVVCSLMHTPVDFDMSLRLQMGGYVNRWASYSKGGFKEGVSLTVTDEM